VKYAPLEILDHTANAAVPRKRRSLVTVVAQFGGWKSAETTGQNRRSQSTPTVKGMAPKMSFKMAAAKDAFEACQLLL
jgi:hypothetical protein